MKKISFIIPVFNGEKYIDECIKSILNQDRIDLFDTEIIVVNDGSTDNTSEILKNYSNKIIAINQQNHGVSYSRNKGIEVSSGDYIVFLDSDDYLLKNFFEKLDAIKNIDWDIIITNFSYGKSKNPNDMLKKIDDKVSLINSIISINFSHNRYKNLPYENARSIGGKIFKASIIKDNKLYFDEELVSFEDGLFILNNLKYCSKLYFWEYEFYYYRILPNSASHKLDPNTIDNLNLIKRKMEEYLENYKGDFESIPYFYFDTIRICINYLSKKYSYKLFKKNLIYSLNNLKYFFYENKIKLNNLNTKEKMVYWLLRLKMYYPLFVLYKRK